MLALRWVSHVACSAYRVEPIEWDGRTYLFVADFGGAILAWDITDILGVDSGTVIDPNYEDYYSEFFLGEWRTTEAVFPDALPNNVWGMALDHVVYSATREEVYVYAAVGRVGIEVLRLLPEAAYGSRLEFLRHIETPSGMAGLKIRDDNLLVGESFAGIRIFGPSE